MHDKTATITPRTSATGPTGAPVPADGAPVTDIACALRAMSSSEAQQWGKITPGQVYDFFCEPFDSTGAALSIKHNAKITINSVDSVALVPSQDMGGLSNVIRTHVERASR